MIGDVPSADHVAPVQLVDWDLERAAPEVVQTKGGTRYRSAQLLVWLHRHPLGLVCIPIDGERVPSSAVAAHVWRELEGPIHAHLRTDGVSHPRYPGTPLCLRGRARLLESAPPVSVVVCTRDRPQLLATCLAHLLAQDYPSFEVLVVDSTPEGPGAPEVTEQSAGAGVVRHLRETGLEQSRARNRALVEARHDLVAFIDDDAVAEPDWLGWLIGPLVESPEVICVTGQTVPLELETRSQQLFEESGAFTKGFDRRVFDRGRHRPPDDDLYPYRAGQFGAGVHYAVRRSVVRTLGGFDTALGGGTPAGAGEDLALFFEVIRSGRQLVYEPRALVRHLHRRDLKGLERQLAGYGRGFSAFVTSTVVRHPESGLELAGKLAAGVRYLVSPRSAKNRRRSPGYPRNLVVRELAGMLIGPAAYLWGRAASAIGNG